jgi:septal ring factor EnvC (AmiA/AmiB activator)
MSFGIHPFNPASPNRSGSLSGSISSHSSTNSSSLFGPFSPTDTSSIESLSARYASVKSLKENFERTQEQLCQANSFATELLKDLQRLRDEKKQLTTTDSMQ